jgi:hypothetical protein
LHLLSRPRRARRSSDWSPAKAVTFIVTLAAHRSVTLAAAEAGMSRRSAYVLKDRDPAFAAAWTAALRARKGRRQGDKVEEVEGPPVSSSQGNSLHAVSVPIGAQIGSSPRSLVPAAGHRAVKSRVFSATSES